MARTTASVRSASVTETSGEVPLRTAARKSAYWAVWDVEVMPATRAPPSVEETSGGTTSRAWLSGDPAPTSGPLSPGAAAWK